jgi:peptide/nickel transport system substrate-binding protein
MRRYVGVTWWTGLLFLAVILGLVASGPAGPAGAADTTLTYALISTGTSKIPAYTTTGEDTAIMAQIYDSLLEADAKTWKIGPDLATAYTTSPDGKTWTFTLRKGVKWQGGYREFTCADVEFTWDFNKDPANHSFWQTQAALVNTVSCPNPYTAVFYLTAPFQGFIWNVVNIEPSTGWVLCKGAWDKLGRAGYEKTPIGTGPYMLKSLAPNQEVSLVRNPDYWGRQPAVGEIDFKVITDSQTAALAVKTGAVDIVGLNDPVVATQYQNEPGVVVIAKQALRTDYLEINQTVQPFDNVKVRQAMRYAIDYPGLVSAVLRGYGTPGYAGIVMPGQTGFDASVNPQNTYDPAKARQLLKESGVAMPIKGFFTTYNDTPDINAAQFLSANFAQVGIDLEPRPLERGTLVQVRIQPATPASVIGNALSPDPDGFIGAFTSGQIPPAGLNIARYTGIDSLFQEQRAVAGAAARTKILREIQQRLAADAPVIEYYVQKEIFLVNSRVHNYEPFVLFGGDPLAKVTLAAK